MGFAIPINSTEDITSQLIQYSKVRRPYIGISGRDLDADTANEVVKSLAGMQHIFDSKLQAGQLLNKKCKGLGLKFDKIKKEYAAA